MPEVVMATPFLHIFLYLHYIFVLETLLRDGSKLLALAWLSELLSLSTSPGTAKDHRDEKKQN